ncbi:PaaI family thioesterase [Nitrogeniibacter mangrovi]|uniref:PaaI family thioesterase n=1 Tax=Nitrogeniibacter mangrovi TaxID=2016596 RepID=A0A6C1B8R5_9RHOO|nr:PaaI family thioesterase [Nitrogeniibacter mangrovi]QID19225.1 PaaI family thioesterase [Nitrogeniibacter mangrovi]
MTPRETSPENGIDSDFRHLSSNPMVRIEGGGDDGTQPVFFEVTERHLNGGGTLHGGVLACALDSALGERVYRQASRRGRGPCRVVTTQLDIHYCEPALAGDRVSLEVSILRMGGRLAVAEALASVGERVIGKAVGAFYLSGSG